MNDPDHAPAGGPACRACGSTQLGRYCAECGHPVRLRRRTLYQLTQDLLANLVNGDFTTLRSVAALVFSPGAISRDAVEDRGRYADPVGVFFAVIVFFAFFYAVHPSQFAQLEFVTVEEYGFANPEFAPDSGVQPRFVFFAPKADGLLSDAVRAMIETDGDEALLARSEDWRPLLAIAETPSEEARLAQYLNTVMAYAPLCVILPILLVNGLIYRRRRYVMDHVMVSFETASILLVLIALVQLGVSAGGLIGVQLWTYSLAGPFLFALIPAWMIALTLIDRRFYRTRWIWLIPKSLLIILMAGAMMLFLAAFSMIQALGG